MKKRSKISRVVSYARHYGLSSAISLAYEKLFLDRKRFSLGEKCGAKLPSGRMSEKGFPRFEGEIFEKKRVLYAVHYFYPERRGGTERFTLNLAKEHKRLGGESVVLVLDANLPICEYPHRIGGILYREYEYDGIRCIAFRHKKAPRGLYYKNITDADFEMRSFARFIIEREKIDVVHATYPQPFVSFLAECRAIGVPYVVTCTDFAMNCRFATMVDKCGAFCDGSCGGKKCAELCKTRLCPDFAERFRAAKEAVEGAFAITAPSDFVCEVMKREFGDIDILTVNHGIGDEFASDRQRDGVKRFLYAGTLSPQKGVHLLISAFSKLEGDFELTVAGEGEEGYTHSLKALADGRVNFVGAIDAGKMSDLYRDADCVVVPSMWYETYNFVLREAGSSGALAVVSDIGAMPEALLEGENGFLFEVGYEKSLGDALAKASKFDFHGYKRLNYPTIADEAKVYEAIYSAAKG